MCLRFADYGCMLEILTLELLPDGRSYVDTVGGSRFRVLKRGQRDGYPPLRFSHRFQSRML